MIRETDNTNYVTDKPSRKKPIISNTSNSLAPLEPQATVFTNAALHYTEKVPTFIDSTVVEVKGRVLDENGKPLRGATIIVKGKNIGGQTDTAGRFSIKIPENVEPILMISHIGMKMQEVNAKNKAFINISLERFEAIIEDAVVVGYAKQAKKDVVASVSTLHAEEIVQENAVNLGNALQGKVNGAVIVSGSGAPGSSRPMILIRGNNPKYSPLIVIDGVPNYQDPGNKGQTSGTVILNGLTIDDINPDQVESVTILKDNEATAMYGTKGAGGVILIETKRGKIGKPHFTFSSNFSTEKPARFPTLLDGYNYGLSANERNANDGLAPLYSNSKLDTIRYGLDPYHYANEDLYSLLVQRNTNTFTNSLSVSGGNDQVRYYLNGSFTNQGGIIDAYNYKRYTVQSNLDVKITNSLKLALNTGFASYTINGATTSADGTFAAILLNSPIVPTYNANGTWYATGLNSNRLANITPDASGYQKNGGNNIVVQANVQYSPAALKGITFRLNSNVNYNAASYAFLQKYYDAYVPDTTSPTGYRKTSGTSGIAAPPSNNLRSSQGNGVAYGMDYGVDYNKKFGLNSLAITALGTYYYNTSSQTTAYRDGIISGLESINYGRSLNQTTGGTMTEAGRVGAVMRASYNYDGKYYAEYTMRADASDNFPPGKRWGFFPGAALGWRLSQEKFIRNNLPFVQDLKLRFSVGLTGVDVASPYSYYYSYTVATTGNNGGGGYAFGNGGSGGTPTYQPSFVLSSTNMPNPNLTWGQSLMNNIGLDFNLWKGLLSGSIDVYNKHLSNLQQDLSASTPATLGIGGPLFNLGKEFYKGFELSLANNTKLNKDMSLQTAFNFTYTYSRVIDYGEPSNTPAYKKKQGRSVTAKSYYQAVGIFQTQDEINSYKVIQDGNNNSTIKPGDIKYADLDGDGVITQNDQNVWYNNTNIPPISWGLNITYRYKNFSVNVFFQGADGNTVMFVPGDFTQYAVDNRWRTTNTNALYPRIANSGQSNNSPSTRPNTQYLLSGDYIRFKNLKFGYNLPTNLLKKAGFSSATVYVAATNLAASSKIKDVDPEVMNTNIANGGYYPIQRNFNCGINIGF